MILSLSLCCGALFHWLILCCALWVKSKTKCSQRLYELVLVCCYTLSPPSLTYIIPISLTVFFIVYIGMKKKSFKINIWILAFYRGVTEISFTFSFEHINFNEILQTFCWSNKFCLFNERPYTFIWVRNVYIYNLKYAGGYYLKAFSRHYIIMTTTIFWEIFEPTNDMLFLVSIVRMLCFVIVDYTQPVPSSESYNYNVHNHIVALIKCSCTPLKFEVNEHWVWHEKRLFFL